MSAAAGPRFLSSSAVERLVETHLRHEKARCQSWASRDGRGHEPEGRRGAGAATPTEVERGRRRPLVEQQANPWDTTAQEIRSRHAPERPALEMFPLKCGIKDDAAARGDEAHAEIDVFHGGLGKAELVEPTKPEEAVSADRPEAGPERRRGTGALLMNVVVKEVAKVGDHPVGRRIVVVRAKDRVEIRVSLERPPDAHESVRVDFDIGVDEDKDIAMRLTGAEISGLTRAGGRWRFDDDQLLGGLDACLDRGEATFKRLWRVGRRDHDGARHVASNSLHPPFTVWAAPRLKSRRSPRIKPCVTCPTR